MSTCEHDRQDDVCWECKDVTIATLEADVRALAEAIECCLGGRGAFSCSPKHDCRCDKDRGISNECVCGADDLDAALARPGVRALFI